VETVKTPVCDRIRRWAAGRARDERGVALLIVLLSTLLLTALALSLVLVSNSETMISANYRSTQEALYGADAGIELVIQDLLTVPQWNDVLTVGGNVQSSFIGSSTTYTLPDGTTIDVAKECAKVQYETDQADIWGTNNPVWQVYAYGPLSDLLPAGVASPVFVVVLVGDDPSESDGNPQADTNGVLTLHAEAWGAGGSHRTIETTVSRTSSTEIERGYVAQRGQEEWNQRSRKAAVQTPGNSLTQMNMGVGTGTLAVQ
jgi:Tfp pilus assembly protein PilX